MKSWLFSKLKGFAPNIFLSRPLADLLLGHIRPSDFMDHWSVQPFNGQFVRHKTISKIIEDFAPTACIETGTYLGSTTCYLASYTNSPVHTIEINEATYLKAKSRHRKNYPGLDIRHVLGDSALEIENVLSTLNPKSDRVLAYLDAHWLDAIPTKVELEKLINWGGAWVAIIDDFQVPSDPGYFFDQYGDVIIGKSQVPLVKNVRTFIPSVSAKFETGAKRGTGYVFSGGSFESLGKSTISMFNEI